MDAVAGADSNLESPKKTDGSFPDWLLAVKLDQPRWEAAFKALPEQTVSNVRTLRRAAVDGYSSLVQGLAQEREALIITITHAKKSYHWEQSGKIRRHWLNELNKRLFGSRYDKRGEGLISFFSFEYQQRGTVHQHGVIAGDELKGIRRDALKAELDHYAQGFCKVELPRNKERSIRYCVKYMAKDGDVDYWLPGALRSMF